MIYSRQMLLNICFMLLSVLAVSTLAQLDCPAIVQQALESVKQQCTEVGRNEACYGYLLLEAEAQDDAADFQFEQPGDLTDVGGIRTLRTTALNPTANTWGVAMMRLQANLPDTDTSENITLLLFGEVEITDASAALPIEITPTQGVKAYPEPSEQAVSTTSLPAGEAITISGRSEDLLWLHVNVASGGTTWIKAAGLDFNEERIALLPQVQTSGAPRFGPMQAFYLKTGVEESPCQQVPTSGLLIQTPEGVGEVNVLVNEVDIQLGSTAFFRAQPEGQMTVSVLEGQAVVSFGDEQQIVPAGSRIGIPIDENLTASGSLGEIEPYDLDDFSFLPIDVLPEEFEIADPLTEAEIAALESEEIRAISDEPDESEDLPEQEVDDSADDSNSFSEGASEGDSTQEETPPEEGGE